jgi:hypothetical protein
MQEDTPKYKLCTADRVSREEALEYFSDFIQQELTYKNKEAYLCVEGSLLIFHASGIENKIFLEIHCHIIGTPGTGQVSWISLREFSKFCAQREVNIKILKTKFIVSPNGGNLISDVLGSLAYKKAMHRACYRYKTSRANKL